MSAMVDYVPLDKGQALFSMGYETRATLVYNYIDYSVSSSPRSCVLKWPASALASPLLPPKS